jgi:hypothetical protein
MKFPAMAAAFAADTRALPKRGQQESDLRLRSDTLDRPAFSVGGDTSAEIADVQFTAE